VNAFVQSSPRSSSGSELTTAFTFTFPKDEP
jgi:hypothetical protein